MLNGIINILKPPGMTSHDVIYKVRRITGIKKVGHTGTLDPDAQGVLPVCIGNGTKLSDMLTVTDKRYTAVMRLGVVTDTQDISGNVLCETIPNVTKDDIIRALPQFTGEIFQIPPMFSAIKVNGKKLYELGRKGIEIEREPRKITVYSIEILKIDGNNVTLDIACSKGTYVRTLCHDIGEKLGVGACMANLIRTESAGFTINESVTLETLEKDGAEKYLIPVEQMFPYDKISVSGETLKKVLNGTPITVSDLQKDKMYKVYDDSGKFLCVSKEQNGVLKMVKCFFG
ncbi:MAG: tRNA pseudouridine(55) synthase TruB [Clostridia bacterium]|nr:tRNA pseudouridine(55) synthase TruB [Clostridia bacterium]